MTQAFGEPRQYKLVLSAKRTKITRAAPKKTNVSTPSVEEPQRICRGATSAWISTVMGSSPRERHGSRGGVRRDEWESERKVIPHARSANKPWFSPTGSQSTYAKCVSVYCPELLSGHVSPRLFGW